MTELVGITWNHTRGWLPLAAAAQRFMDERPEVQITWHRRSLQEFADYPIQKLAERFDMIVIDHPFAGYAASHPVLVPLDLYLSETYLADQRSNSVGKSFESYECGGHLWALPIDAATPVSSARLDVLERFGEGIPKTWDELLALARKGLVALPAIPIDALMATYMVVIGLGETPFANGSTMASPGVGTSALEALRELVKLCDPACLTRNPIRTYEAMIRSDTLGYCPFAYGYTNYSRASYTVPRPTLTFGNLVTMGNHQLCSTLGGTGLAVTERCTGASRDLAVEFAAFCCSREVQRGMWTIDGGQPGHRAAWLSPECNAMTGNFFANTLKTLDEAFVRPRHSGGIPFQDEASVLVHRYLVDGGNAASVASEIDRLYQESLSHGE
ncbi:MAG: ABC transporter substrate-binding protein [Chloroflexota bacterium]